MYMCPLDISSQFYLLQLDCKSFGAETCSLFVQCLAQQGHNSPVQQPSGQKIEASANLLSNSLEDGGNPFYNVLAIELMLLEGGGCILFWMILRMVLSHS